MTTTDSSRAGFEFAVRFVRFPQQRPPGLPLLRLRFPRLLPPPGLILYPFAL
jgi:hypothetical protein